MASKKDILLADLKFCPQLLSCRDLNSLGSTGGRASFTSLSSREHHVLHLLINDVLWMCFCTFEQLAHWRQAWTCKCRISAISRADSGYKTGFHLAVPTNLRTYHLMPVMYSNRTYYWMCYWMVRVENFWLCTVWMRLSWVKVLNSAEAGLRFMCGSSVKSNVTRVYEMLELSPAWSFVHDPEPQLNSTVEKVTFLWVGLYGLQ